MASNDAAKFVFKGTVRRTKAANLKAITDKSRTVIVRVEEVLRAPEALAGYVGQDVTVQLAKFERVKKGQQAIFYTNGWIFGEHLAVRSLGHEKPKSARRGRRAFAAAAAVKPVDPVAVARQHDVRECATGAPLVIRGKVIAVGQAETGKVQRISEHEPFWMEAIVEVHEVLKGNTRKKRVVVRFPDSEDAHWADAPKFQVGHEGVFMLEADKVTKVDKLGAAAEALGCKETFTCLLPASFHHADCHEEIATAIDAAKAKMK